MPGDADERFDPAPVLELFAQANVDFVVIGGVAGGAHGSPYGTFDVDLAYDTNAENLERIATVLRSIGATLRGARPDLPFQLDARTLKLAETSPSRRASAPSTSSRFLPVRRLTTSSEPLRRSSTSEATPSESPLSTT